MNLWNESPYEKNDARTVVDFIDFFSFFPDFDGTCLLFTQSLELDDLSPIN